MLARTINGKIIANLTAAARVKTCENIGTVEQLQQLEHITVTQLNKWLFKWPTSISTSSSSIHYHHSNIILRFNRLTKFNRDRNITSSLTYRVQSQSQSQATSHSTLFSTQHQTQHQYQSKWPQRRSCELAWPGRHSPLGSWHNGSQCA